MELIDNSTATLREWLYENTGRELQVATGFFTLDGVATLLSILPNDGKLQLVASQEIATGDETLATLLKEEANSEEMVPALRQVYDALGDQLTVRVHNDLHAKLYLTNGRGVIGSSNTTTGGLTENIELNRELHPETVKEASQWFNDIWQRSDPFTNQTMKILERSDTGKELVEPPLEDPSRLNRTYGRVGREIASHIEDWSLPGQLARIDAKMGPTDLNVVPLQTFSSGYDYYEDLLEAAAHRRTNRSNELIQLLDRCNKNTNYLWKLYHRAGEPCSVPIEPGGKLWLLDWFIEREGNVSLSEDLPEYHNEQPVLMVNLWDNQVDAIDAWINAGRDGIVEMATATGKTVVGLAAITELCGSLHGFGEPRTRDAKVLVVVHTRALREQWETEIRDKLGLSSRKHADSESRIVNAGTGQIEIQTPQYIAENLNEFREDTYDLVVYDEVHHYSRPQGWGKAIEDINRRATLGLTATISEIQRQALESRLGEIVCSYGLSDAQTDGIIPEFDLFFHPVQFTEEEQVEVDNLNQKIQSISSKLSDDPETRELLEEFGYSLSDSVDFLSVFQQAFNKVRRSDEEVLPDEWQQLISLFRKRREIEYAAEQAQEQAINLAREYVNEGRKVIVFSMRVDETAKPIADAIPQSYVVYGDQNSATLKNRLDKFRESDQGALVAAKLLDEGVDLPEAEIGINVAGTKTQLQFVQRIGRLLRREGTVKPTFHHFMMEANESFYKELAPIEPTAVHPDPSPNIKSVLPFEVGTVRVGEILESLSTEEAQRLLTSDQSVTDIHNGSKWWLGIYEKEYPDLWETVLREKISN